MKPNFIIPVPNCEAGSPEAHKRFPFQSPKAGGGATSLAALAIGFCLCLSGVESISAQVPAVPNAIPNVTQVPGKLLFRSATTQSRITNIAYHNGQFYTNMVTGANRKVWRFSDPTLASSLTQDLTRNDGNIPLFNDHGNHGHSKSGDYIGGGFGFGIKRDSLGVNINQDLPDYGTFSPYQAGGHSMYWPWRLPFNWVQYAGINSAAPTNLIRPGATGPQTLFAWNSLAEDGVTGNSILLGNLFFVTSDNSGLGVLCYDISPVFKSPPERPVLLDKLTGNFGAYIAVPFEHYIILAGQTNNKVDVIDFADPTDLKHVASIDVTGNPSWVGETSVPYTQAQDNFIFTMRHKIDMDSFTPVLEFDQVGNNRPAGSVAGSVDTSQYMKPIGNLLVAAGYSFQDSDRLSVWAHQAAPDTKKPYVGYHLPRPAQANFPLGAPISLMIHEALESYTIVNGISIILREVGTTTPLDCWTSFSHDGILTLTPKTYLQLNKTYEVVVVDGLIKDAIGNGIEPYSFTFSTGNAASGGNNSPTINSFIANPSPVAPGGTVNFPLGASDPESDSLQYRINYGDGTPTTAWGANTTFSRSYASAGHYVAKLQVRDLKPGGAVSVVSKDLTITVGTAPSGTLPTRSSTIALNASARRVWSVNADADTVTVLNADTNAKLAEYNLNSLLGISGSIDPRNVALDSSGNAWVTCHDADRIAVISSSGALLGQIDTGYGSSPFGVATTPDGSAAFVTLTGSGIIKRYSTSSRAETGSLPLGPTPRAIAITGDGSRVLVTRYLSEPTRGSVWDVANAPSLSLNNVILLNRNLIPDSSNNGRGIPNQLSGITISQDNQTAWVTASKMNDEAGAMFAGAVTTDNVVRAMILPLNLGNSNEPSDGDQRLDIDNSESPTSVTFSPLGDWAFVTLQGNNDIAVYDMFALQAGASRITRWRFPADLAPQGQVFDPVSRKLFVNNFMARNVSIHDLTGFLSQGTRFAATVKVNAVSNEKLPANVLNGKQTFYNASLKDALGEDAMSRQTYISCATCHSDGAQDGRIWDFTQRDEGFRNTTDLRGRAGMGHGNVHWTANFDEIQDFENDIRAHFGGTGLSSAATISTPLGTPKAGLSSQLDNLAAYVTSLGAETLPKSPNRNASGVLSAAATAGQAIFNSQSCTSCHSGPNFTDSTGGVSVQPTLHDVGTLRTTSGKRIGATLTGIDTPTLLGIHSTAPYFHDGSAPTIADVFKVAGGTTYQAETGTLAGSVETPNFISQNFYNMLQNNGMVIWGGTGTWTMPNVAGGSGGVGAIEFRFTAGVSSRTVTVRVNSTDYNIQLTGLNRGWQFNNYINARLEGVNLNAGNGNVISITHSQGDFGIDSMTVTTATELAKAQPHRRVLALAAVDQANLIQYLRELDGSSVGGNVATVATPTLSLASGNYSGPQNVTISTNTSGATLRYTLDGSDPTASNGTFVNGQSLTIVVNPTVTLKARAFAVNLADSSIAFATYTLVIPIADTPSFSLPPGSYAGPQQITVSSSQGTFLRYTTDGVDPTPTSGTLISSSSGIVTISQTSTLKAIAFGSNLIQSAIRTASYTILAGSGDPVVSIGGTGEASSNPVSSESAGDAFDGLTSTKWLGNMTAQGAWLSYTFGNGAAYRITGYRISSANDDNGRHPRDFKLQGSNDGGATWTDIVGSAQSGQDYVAAFNTVAYVSSGNLTAYSRVRLFISANNGSTESGTGLVQLSELVLQGTVGGPPPPTPPATPSNPLATANSASQVTFTWTDVSDETGYEVQWANNSGFTSATTLASLSANSTSAVIGSLNASTPYWFRVRATKTDATESAYATATATTQAIPITGLDYAGGFTSGAQLAMNGGATVSNNRLILTSNGPNEARSAFFNTKQNIQNFSSSFRFQVNGNREADGFTMVFQNAGPTALGAIGGGFGYNGIATSVALKFNLWSAVSQSGLGTSVNNNAVANVATGTINMRAGNPINTVVSYAGTRLTLLMTDSVTGVAWTKVYTVNIPSIVGANTAWVGFTGATGGASASFEIVNWTWSAGLENNVIYEIEPQNAVGKRLDVAAGSVASGTAIQLWTDNNSNAQRWQIQVQSNGNYELVPQSATTLRLTARAPGNVDGNLLEQATDANTNAQRWNLIDQGNGIYEFAPQSSTTRRANVIGAGTADGTGTEIRTDNNNSGMRWKLLKQ